MYILYYIILYYIILYYIILYYIILYYIISYYNILYYIILYYIILYYIISYYNILYYIVLYYIISYYIILYHIILYYIILNNIISYYMIFYYIISYRIILYYIILYIWKCTEKVSIVSEQKKTTWVRHGMWMARPPTGRCWSVTSQQPSGLSRKPTDLLGKSSPENHRKPSIFPGNSWGIFPWNSVIFRNQSIDTTLTWYDLIWFDKWLWFTKTPWDARMVSADSHVTYQSSTEVSQMATVPAISPRHAAASSSATARNRRKTPQTPHRCAPRC